MGSTARYYGKLFFYAIGGFLVLDYATGTKAVIGSGSSALNSLATTLQGRSTSGATASKQG